MSDHVDRPYRADIDGLRAIAVLAVLVFHYGAAWLPGGFAGVDVFLVISGFLITRNLTARILDDGLRGRALIFDFYHRRVLRILPAALVMLAIALVAGWWLLLPGDYADLGQSAGASAIGVANVYFYRHTGYFDREATLQPLLHMWSLGVEEQFYVVWPLLLAFVLALTRGRPGRTAGLVATLMTASFVGDLLLLGTNPKAAFYWPDARAWELAAGALLVFLPTPPRRWWSAIAQITGLALIGVTFVRLGIDAPFPGWRAIMPVAGTALVIWAADRTRITRVLSVRPLVFVGLISYSLYLWHWPILVFYRTYINSAMPSARGSVALAALTVAISWVSWRFIESVRARRVSPKMALTTGVAAALLVLVCGIGLHAAKGLPSRVPSDAADMASLEQMWTWRCTQSPPIAGLATPYCVFGGPWQGSPVKAILWGDSQAEHLAPMIEAAGRPTMSVLLYNACPASLGGRVYRRDYPDRPTYRHDCEDARTRGVALLRANPGIQIVVLAASWARVSDVAEADGALSRASGVEKTRAGLLEVIDEVALSGRTVVLVGTIPQFHRDPVPCALRGEWILRAGCAADDAHVSAAEYLRTQGPANDMLRSLARERPNVVTLVPGDALCQSGVCQDWLDGHFLYRDALHLRRNLDLPTRRDYADRIGLTALLRTLEGHALADQVPASEASGRR